MDRTSTSLEGTPQAAVSTAPPQTPPFSVTVSFSSVGDPESPETSTTTFTRELTTLRTIIGRGPFLDSVHSNAAGATSEVGLSIPNVPAVSQQHLVVSIHPSGQVFLQDLGSSNGTYLMTTPEPLKLEKLVMYQWNDCQNVRVAFGTRGALSMVLQGPLPSKEQLRKALTPVSTSSVPSSESSAAPAPLPPPRSEDTEDDDDDDAAPPPSALINFQRRKSNQSDNDDKSTTAAVPTDEAVVAAAAPTAPATDAQPTTTSLTSLVSFTSTPPKELPQTAVPYSDPTVAPAPPLAATMLPATLLCEDILSPAKADALPATLLVDSPPQHQAASPLPATLLVGLDAAECALPTTATAPLAALPATLMAEEEGPAAPSSSSSSTVPSSPPPPPAVAKRGRAPSQEAEEEDATPPPPVANLRAKRARSEEAAEVAAAAAPVPPVRRAPPSPTPTAQEDALCPASPTTPQVTTTRAAPPPTPEQLPRGPGWSEITSTPTAAVIEGPGFSVRGETVAADVSSVPPVVVTATSPSPTRVPQTVAAPPPPPISTVTASPAKRAPMAAATPVAAPKVAHWQYKTDLRKKDDKDEAWTDYSASDSATIEAGYQLFVSHAGKKTKKVVECTLNPTYGIHFEDLVQFRFDDRSRQRPVRRVEK